MWEGRRFATAAFVLLLGGCVADDDVPMEATAALPAPLRPPLAPDPPPRPANLPYPERPLPMGNALASGL